MRHPRKRNELDITLTTRYHSCMMKDSDGKPSWTLTLTVIAHAIVFLKFLLSGVVIGSLAFGTIDAAVVMAILGAVTSGYVARRYTTAKFESVDLQTATVGGNVDLKTATVGASTDLKTEKDAQ